MKTFTPTQAAHAYGIRNFGPFWLAAMTEASRKQIMKAYIAGLRAGRNGKRK